MMKTKTYIFMMISLIATLCVGCSSDEKDDDIVITPEEPQAVMKLYVYMPQQMAGTRAYTGDIAADNANESIVKSLEIWVFDHSSGLLLFHVEEEDAAGLNYTSGMQKEFVFTNKDYKVNQPGTDDAKLKDIYAEHQYVDVYALINAASIGQASLDENTPKATLDALTLGDNEFGFNGTAYQSSPSSDGLPMSGVLKNYEIQRSGTNLFLIQTIFIKRCVSKMRVVVTRSPEMEHATISSVKIVGGSIPTTESVFNDNAGANVEGESRVTKTGTVYYSAQELLSQTVTTADIAAHPTPLTMVWDGTNFNSEQAYEDAMNNAISAGNMTELIRAYLHESSQQIAVEITYKSKEEDVNWKTATITIEDAGDFARNHSWIIYAYFVDGKLYVKPTLIPWIAGQNRYTYATRGNTRMEFEVNTKYLRYDPVNLNYWSDSYTMVAYAFNANGMPTSSPKIILRTEHDYALQLQLNNADFDIIVLQNNEFVHYGTSYTIPASSSQVVTTFWVTPINSSMPADLNANLMLTLLRPDDPFAVPYNHELPGNEAHTTIKYRYISATRYDELMNGASDPYKVETIQ